MIVPARDRAGGLAVRHERRARAPGRPTPATLHGHLLKPGDVAAHAIGGSAAPSRPTTALPIPRADIPPGIILSREADAWIREEQVEDVALPLYEGRMIGQFDFSQKGWVQREGPRRCLA